MPEPTHHDDGPEWVIAADGTVWTHRPGGLYAPESITAPGPEVMQPLEALTATPSAPGQPTMPALYAALGSLLELLADVPLAQAPTNAQWSVGYQPAVGRGIDGTIYGDGTRELLDLLAERLGGEVTGESAIRSGNRRMHKVRGTHAGVPVLVTMWLPEPTEREALIARLAELDAAEAAKGGVR